MARVCSNCGTEAADSDRFCSHCGTPLDASEGAERKLATMVFVDLVGSTELSAGSDPEELRGRLEPFFEVARSSLREHGGTIEKYLGDAVLAVFGVPQAHGDDPDRAVAAALDVAERVRGLEQGLAVRVGVESGEVLAQDGGGDFSVTGEPVNAAARLQQAAAPGEVLVGERAARYCRRASLEPNTTVDAKGMPSPLRSWRAVGTMEGDAEEPSTPLIGRDDDLDLLRLVYRRSVRERVPELVILTGEAGIGKTRLGNELLEELRSGQDAPRVLVGRNPPYGRGIAFWALAEIIRDAAGTGPDASIDEVRTALAELLDGFGAEDAEEVVTELSGTLGAKADGSEEVSEELLKHSWRRFVALLAEERPLVLAIDDAHWADDGLLDLIEETAFRIQSAPVMILCTTRPELAERRPDFGRSRNVTQIELRPLKPQDATRLVELLVPAKDRNLAPRAAEASGGNPFFAEEVARRISEDTALVEQLPDTVQAAIAARIDLLPAEEKQVIQYASVLGHTFRIAGLSDLLGAEPSAAMVDLERRALIQERLTDGVGRYTFRHSLIRDVAYASLPRAERASLHERAADGVGRRASHRHAEVAELIAFHLSRAAELEPTPERGAAAREATFEAAEIAVRRGATARGQELYEQVAAAAEDDEAKIAPLRAAALVALRRWRGDKALRLLREAAGAAERAGDDAKAGLAYGEALEVATRMAGVTGALPEPEMEAMLERGRTLADPDDECTQALLVLDEAWIAWISGRPDEMEAPARRALEMARATGDVGLISSALDAVAAASWDHGRQREAVDYTRERLELLDAAEGSKPREGDGRASHGLEVERSDARHMMTESLMDTGELNAAYENAVRAREIDESLALAHVGYTRTLLPAFYLGKWEEVIEMAGRFREAWPGAGRPPVAAVSAAVASVGAIHGYRGDEAAAADWFEFAAGIAPDVGQQRAGFAIWQTEIHIHHGRFAAAADRVAGEDTGFWWRGQLEATRAEAFVRAGRAEADAAIAEAEETVGQHVYAQALLLRAKAIQAGEDSMLSEALGRFEQLGCPFQAARTGWLLGGEARQQAQSTFERLGAVLPADPA